MLNIYYALIKIIDYLH